MIKFFCPHCHKKLGVPYEYAGNCVRCSNCKEPCTVPQPHVESELKLAPEPVLAGASSAGHFENADDSHDLFGDMNYVEEGPNQAAIAAARAGRRKQQSKTSRAARPSRSSTSGGSITTAKIPLAICASIGMSFALAVIWALVAKFTRYDFFLFPFGVASVAALGVVMFTDTHSNTIGVFCVVLACLGLLFGKVLITKWLFIDQASVELTEMTQKEYDNYNKGMSAAQRKEILNAPGNNLLLGAIQLYKTNVISEEDAKEVIQTFWQGYEEFTDEQTKLAAAQIYTLVEDWSDEDLANAYRTYGYDMFNKYGKWGLINESMTFSDSFVGAFGIWDLFVLPLSLISAFKIGSGKD